MYRYTVLRLYIPKISKNHTDYIHTRKLSQAISVFIFFRYLFSNRTITFAGAAHCIPKAFAKETPCIDIVSPLNYSKWKNHMPYLKLLKPITWSPHWARTKVPCPGQCCAALYCRLLHNCRLQGNQTNKFNSWCCWYFPNIICSQMVCCLG